MKRVSTFVLGLLLLSFCSTSSMAQKKEAMPVKMKAGAQKTMSWTTSSKAAREWAQKGSLHFLNAEWPQAYDYFNRASNMDPNFTEPLIFMSWMAAGQSKKDLAQRALKSATNKPEGEKLWASILDEKSTPESRREAWTKLNDMYPEDPLVASGFVRSRATLDERIAAAGEFLQKFPNAGHMHNSLGYYYMEKKDNETAKKHFEKYIELYPEGYNPYDSMGEYYLTIGDLDNAEKYYTMALEKYPFISSAQEAMAKIKMEKEKKNPEAKKE
ncbi:MAG TPA: tetratricopeptide repeat protein [Chitinophagaceae bacterium]